MVTTSEQSALHGDVDRPLNEMALAACGVELVAAPWDDPAVSWDGFDLVVVRSPWNYPEHLAEFLGWLDAREGLAAFHNPAALIRWNLDKRYLARRAVRRTLRRCRHRSREVTPTSRTCGGSPLPRR